MMSPVAYCFTGSNLVACEFLDYVTELTARNIDRFLTNDASPNRKFLRMDNVTQQGDNVLFSVKQQLAQHYQLGDYIAPPGLEDFIGYITEGGAVHPHKDHDLPDTNKTHVRVNLLVKQTEDCIPILDGVPIKVAVGDCWLNIASKCTHATTPVVGPGYRSVFSFGYQIDQKRGDELYEAYLSWLSVARGVSLPQ